MEESYGGPEKRGYKRLEKQFVIKMRIHSGDRIETISDYNMVSIQNISAGGALISYDRPIELGALVDIDMRFSGVPNPVSCIGKVVRIKPPGPPKSPLQLPIYYIGISFADIKEEDKEKINEIIEKYYSR